MAALCSAAFFSCKKEPVEDFPLSENTYLKESLELTCSGSRMEGKQVLFSPEIMDETKAVLEFSGLEWGIGANKAATPGILPGVMKTVLDVDIERRHDGILFSGSGVQDGISYTCTGSIDNNGMKADLTVTQPEHRLTGSHPVVKADPLIVNWESSQFMLLGKKWDMNELLSMILNLTNARETVGNCMHEVRFTTDGNMRFVFSRKDNLEERLVSPCNLTLCAGVTDTDFTMYVNPFAFGSAAVTDTVAVAGTKAIKISELIADVSTVLSTYFSKGIEVSYTVNPDGTARIFVDKETLLPVLELLRPLFEDENFRKTLIALVKELAPPALSGFIGPIITPFFKQLPAIIDGTVALEFGLNVEM